ncbi:hypothetical protein I553_3747 [Mycobacterium xenopi 4042]|uniref:Uncharacterized protein n=1 Tax=Mycobacterium xenopi 4042 TaxID=1299334 RepID=X7YT36_MYCXE|nr:hypothetical protein I553_3747 [Mycobacterium xenopi 4042]
MTCWVAAPAPAAVLVVREAHCRPVCPNNFPRISGRAAAAHDGTDVDTRHHRRRAAAWVACRWE